MTKKTYVAITTRSRRPCFLTKEATSIANSTWRCAGCSAPKPYVTSIDVQLETTPKGKPLNFVFGDAVTVAYKPFLMRFTERLVERDLYLGRVYGPKGNLITDWVTIRGRKRLIIRGTKEAGFRRCDQCGQDVYSALDHTYLYPQPPNDIVIFERAGGGGLIVPEEMFSVLDISEWHQLYIDELQVMDPPPDGLGELPNV